MIRWQHACRRFGHHADTGVTGSEVELRTDIVKKIADRRVHKVLR